MASSTCVTAGSDDPAATPAQCQLLICTSRGAGAPAPVSTKDFRLIRNEAHLVLQWCMNSTGSRQPACVNSTIVYSPSWRRSQSIVVPTHSAGPSATRQVTRLPVVDSSTSMSKPPTGGKRNFRTPPTSPLPVTSSVHQPARPSTVVSASYTRSGVGVATPILCRMSTISVSSVSSVRKSAVLGVLDRLGDPLDPLQPGVPCRPDRRQLGHRAGELLVVHPVPLLPARRGRPHQADPVQHAQVLGHRLAADRQLLPQAGRGAVAGPEQEVEHPPPRRVPDGRPEVVVDLVGQGIAHGRDT